MPASLELPVVKLPLDIPFWWVPISDITMVAFRSAQAFSPPYDLPPNGTLWKLKGPRPSEGRRMVGAHLWLLDGRSWCSMLSTGSCVVCQQSFRRLPYGLLNYHVPIAALICIPFRCELFNWLLDASIDQLMNDSSQRIIHSLEYEYYQSNWSTPQLV